MTDLSNVSTEDLLAAAPPSPQVFAQRFGEQAARAGAALGVDPNLLLAQWGHETGWGKSIIPGTNNLGNIKGKGPTATDNMTGSRDSYAAYQTPNDFADAYAGLIQRKYPNAVGAGSDVNKFTAGLKGYAEDPSYALRLASAAKTLPQNPGLLERVANAIIPQAQAADLSQASNEELLKAAGIQVPAAPVAQPQAVTPAPAQPGFFDELGHQLGRTAGMVGRGLADAYGIVADPAIATVNAVAGTHYALPSKALKHDINQSTPAAQNTAEQIVGDIGEAVANPASYLAGPVAAGGGIARAALAGAIGAGLQPTDSLPDFAQNLALGAVGGGALGAAGKAVSGAVLSPAAQALRAKGVTLTPGQAIGGLAKRAEEKLTSVPVLGDAITSAQKRGVEDFNRAIYADVVAPIKGTVPDNVGRDAVDSIRQQISDKYDQLLPKMTFKVDRDFLADLQPIAQRVADLPQDIQKKFGSVINRNFMGQLDNGTMDGAMLKQAESNIGREASAFKGSTDAFQRDMGTALSDFQSAIRNQLQRSNPQHADELKAINQAYSNYSILRNAAQRVNNPDKPILPGQYQAAVKQADKSVGKGRYATGAARNQALSDAGLSTLGQTYPDSGTAGRMMLGTGLLGGIGLASPTSLITGLGLAGLYGTQPGRRAMLGVLASRPEWARAFGQALPAVAPGIGAGTAGILGGGQ